MALARLTFVFSAIPICLLIGCSLGHRAGETDSATTGVARTEITRGPVQAVVEIKPSPARLSDEPTLTLTIGYERGVKVEKPPFGEAMGDFIVRDFYEPLPETKGDREIVRQVYTLEPTTTGPLQVDPIGISFTDSRPGGDGKQHLIETDALTLEVMSVVASQAPSLDDLDDFATPIDLPASRAWIAWLLLVPALLLPLAVVALLVARRTRIFAAEEVTPREQAHLALQRLWASWIGDEDVKEFYVQLTGIVRHYIEGTTGIHAPEQTTEEFLRAIGDGEAFGREERQKLQDFLESADLVKFAAYQPATSDVEESYHRARRFAGLDVAEEVAACTS